MLLRTRGFFLRKRPPPLFRTSGFIEQQGLSMALPLVTRRRAFSAASTLQEIQEDADLPLRILRLPDVEPAEKAAALKALEKAHHPLPTAVTFCRDLATNSDPELRQAAESVLSCLEKEITAPKPPSTRRFFGWKLKR